MKNIKVGDTIYWMDDLGVIYDEICVRISDYPGEETLYYTYETANGGGSFLAESDLLDPDSDEVQEYKKKVFEAKINDMIDNFQIYEIYKAFYDKLCNHFTKDTTEKILDIICSK